MADPHRTGEGGRTPEREEQMEAKEETKPREDGGPAFPQSLMETRDGAIQASYDAPNGSGMTLRDYFAAKALQGAIASYSGPDVSLPNTEWIARTAYQYADAMLNARR
jgi:hypothetical protein